MKLYVCYGTRKPAPRPGGHPCGNAYHALRDAGHDPDVQRCYGLGALPAFLILNQTPGGREVKRLTGSHRVPALATDDGTVSSGSRQLIEWAARNPATDRPAAKSAA
jgi:hypothetical protein